MTLEETETNYGITVRQIESIEEFLQDKKDTFIDDDYTADVSSVRVNL
jgi:hypothetical protein